VTVDGDKVIPVYTVEKMLEWGGFLGMSGTIESCVQTQMTHELKNPQQITIPSLRSGGSINKITEVK